MKQQSKNRRNPSDRSNLCRPHLELLEARLPLGDALLGAMLGISLGGSPLALGTIPGSTPTSGAGATGGQRKFPGRLADLSRSMRPTSSTGASAESSFIPPSFGEHPAVVPSLAPKQTSGEPAGFTSWETVAAIMAEGSRFTNSHAHRQDSMPAANKTPEVRDGASIPVREDFATVAFFGSSQSAPGGAALSDALLTRALSLGRNPASVQSRQDPSGSISTPATASAAAAAAGEAKSNDVHSATSPGPGCSVSLVPDQPAPQLVGQRIVWTATATNCGDDPVYQFRVGLAGNPLQLMRDFSTTASFAWAPIQEGIYDVQVTVKDGFEAEQTVSADVSDTVYSRVIGSNPVVTPMANPLVALYSVPPCSAGSVRIDFRPQATSDLPWMSTDTKSCEPGRSTNFLVAGMLPRTTYEMVNITSHGRSAPLFFTTGALPAELTFPTFTAKQMPDLGSNLSQGMVFHMALGRATPSVNVLATDLMGNVNWYYYPVASGLASTFATSVVPGGSILLFDDPLGGNVLREVDLAGNPLRETNLDAINAQLAARGQQPIADLHHDAQRLPDGKTVVLAQTERTVDINGTLRQYDGDMVIVLDRDFQVTWTWDAFNYLDVHRGPIGEDTSADPVDWMHSNAVNWSPADGDLVVSVRHQDWVIKIDYANGAGDGHVVWRLGQGGDFTIDSQDPYPWFTHQHDAHYIDNSNMILFDNGNTRCADTSDCNSRGQVLRLDEQNLRATLVLNADLGNYSYAVGSAQALPNGNFIFTSGFLGQPPEVFGQSIEMLPDGTPTSVLQIGSWEYRSFRMAGLYRGDNPIVNRVPFFAVGGAPGHVALYRRNNSLVTDFSPWPAYTGGISVAVADVNGDGYYDLIIGNTAGIPEVRVYDGRALATGTFDPANPDASLLARFLPYGTRYPVGVNVAAGDISGDGFADIVTGAASGNPDVRIYRGRDIADHTFNLEGASLLAQFFPYALQSNIGVNVAVGDINRDGFADIVTGATTGNPHVRVYSGMDIARNAFDAADSSLLAEWFAFALNLNLGATVAVGNTTGDGFADVIVGATTGNPDVRVYSGYDIARHIFGSAGASPLDQFFAYDLDLNIGVTLASADFDMEGKAEILTGASRGAPHYRVVPGNATGIKPPALFEGFAPGIVGGITVGA